MRETGPFTEEFDNPVFILPEGYRPQANQLLPVACADGSMDHAGVVEIAQNGWVALRDIYSDCRTSDYVSLSGLTFYAG